ncbi:MAG: iron complex outermembrane recepter protein [Bacteroidetes bacterium]|nr:MAG: iron complex outermembrane recepter protein [Bacteroidota bacterium]
MALPALLLPATLSAQVTLSGSVTDKENNNPLAFAGIGVSGTFIGVQSGIDGKYNLVLPKAGKYAVYIRLLGYRPLTDTIDVNENTTHDFQLEPNAKVIDEVIVISTRASDKSGLAFTNVSKEELEKQNFGQDVPYVLNQLPSVVTTSDAGAGIGYTGIRVRGTDGTRINVTINGIPVNDAESQGAFWVDFPDLLSSTDNIQLQRGVGTSTNGAGAFGASLNMQTSTMREKAYGEIMSGYGSFNTQRQTVNFGTGLLNDHWTVDGRLSRILSDGYIDRASADMKSYYLSGGYYGKKAIVKAVVFSGLEKTYQAWYGVPESYADTNRTYNAAGLHTDARGNLLFYENQTDNYHQDNYQLHYAQRIKENWHLNTALHYTKGRGYYEEYKDDETLYDYNIEAAIIGNDTITTSDLIRRKWLDNDFYGMTWSLNYNGNKRFSANIGGGANRYDGSHFGRVIWAQYASNSSMDWEYYNNDAQKTDVNVYAKAGYAAGNKLNLFGDIQYRMIGYDFLGIDQNALPVDQSVQLNFFNPKAGLRYDVNDKHAVYASFSMGNKEPNRDDYTQSSPASRPEHESLQDAEAGWKFNGNKVQAGVNLYYMNYKNQLVLTGKVNDVGSYTRTNVDKSFRRGVELEVNWKMIPKLSLSGNATLSQNKILDFEEFIDDYDNGGQLLFMYAETDIAFSPAAIGAAKLEYEPCKGASIAFTGKYVGEQFLDNTASDNRKLDAYFISDMRFGYKFSLKKIREIGLAFQLNNLLNTMYSSNGYTFSYQYGNELITENYVYPQAGLNFMTMLTLKF